MSANIFSKTALFFLLLIVSVADVAAQSNELNKPIPVAARQSLKQANKFADREKFTEAIAELKKAIAKAPNFVSAHARYIYLKSYLMEQSDAVNAEYETLTTKNPANPVYPAALAIGLFAAPPATKNKWLELVVKLAPDWAWGHYAKAQLAQEKEPETALAEYSKAIEKDSTLSQAYSQMIFIQDSKLNKIDDAIATAEKMALQPDLKTAATSQLWRLRLEKAGTTEEAKAKLRGELSQIVRTSGDAAALVAARSAYLNLLKDKETATATEEKIKRLDAFWYPERDTISFSMTYGESGPRKLVYAGRQLSVHNKLREIGYDLESKEQTTRLEQLLSLNPNNELKKSIYDRLIGLSINDKNDQAVVAYGEKLLAIEPKDVSVLATLARTLSNQKRDLEKALHYASRAEELTRKLVIVKDVQGIAGNKFLKDYYSEKEQMDRYNVSRANALAAYGWVLFQTGKAPEAETSLREAIKLRRSEKRLSDLSQILRALNKIEEADRFAAEAKIEYTANILRQFKNEPAKDFELSTIDGRKVKLSDLKGKVVMVNFWATWCKPCVQEMPHFVKAYEKYKDRGFEILAITVDALEDRPKVVSLIQQQKISFPILYDKTVAALYGARSFPTTFFVGKQGTIRYQNSGFNPQTGERDLEIIIEGLMKD